MPAGTTLAAARAGHAARRPRGVYDPRRAGGAPPRARRTAPPGAGRRAGRRRRARRWSSWPPRRSTRSTSRPPRVATTRAGPSCRRPRARRASDACSAIWPVRPLAHLANWPRARSSTPAGSRAARSPSASWPARGRPGRCPRTPTRSSPWPSGSRAWRAGCRSPSAPRCGRGSGCWCSARPAPSAGWPCRRRCCSARAWSSARARRGGRWPSCARSARGPSALDGAGDDLAGALREPFGERGPDVVLDPLYGAPLRAALEVAAPGARVVQMGQSAGAEARARVGHDPRQAALDPRLLEPGDPARGQAAGPPRDARPRRQRAPAAPPHALPAERGRRGLRGRPPKRAREGRRHPVGPGLPRPPYSGRRRARAGRAPRARRPRAAPAPRGRSPRPT